METTHYTDIFDYVTSMEAMYRRPVPINEKWDWSMKDHILTSELYKNTQFLNGKDDFTPFKNITRPILNLQYRAEDIDVKDVEIYVDDPENYHLSFLVKKYHDDVFVAENDLDTFFDELNESRIDFGGGLSKAVGDTREVVPLQSIVFCDQTDLLSGPIGIKHYYSPDQLLDMASRGWGEKANGATASLEDVIVLSREEKKDDKNGTLAPTPGRYIEVYEVHGNLPKRFSDRNDLTGKYETRIFICCFYNNKDGQKNGIILYSAPETKSPFKLIKRDAVFGRALGFGGAEEIREPQVWVNYDMKRKLDMKDAASKTLLKSTDPAISQKHPTGLKNLENLEIIDVQMGTDISQIDTFPRNMALFDQSVQEWEAHAQQIGAANDSIMGEAPSAGTPFKLQELVTQESHSLHDWRRGKFAKHLEEIYKDDYIPKIEKKITQGTKFLSELSLDELQYVTDCVVRNTLAKQQNERVLNGEDIMTDQEKEAEKQKIIEDFKAKGTKHFIEILKGEFKGKPLAVKVNIKGKQKNLALRVDKLTNIFRTITSAPQVLQDPAMAGLFNQIIEASGLDPVDFSNFKASPPPQPAQPGQPGQPQPSPMQPQPTPYAGQ